MRAARYDISNEQLGYEWNWAKYLAGYLQVKTISDTTYYRKNETELTLEKEKKSMIELEDIFEDLDKEKEETIM